jgi:hypothetical protein
MGKISFWRNIFMTTKRFSTFILMFLVVIINTTTFYANAKDYDTNKIKLGMKSTEVETAWGKPNEIKQKGDKTIWTYIYSQKQESGVTYTKYYFLYFDKASNLVMADSMESLSPPTDK